MKYIIQILCLCMSLFFTNVSGAVNQINDQNTFLAKPSGNYAVSYKDYHWINENVCPDPSFNGKNQVDFSPDNVNKCHEIMVRIYYPTLSTNLERAPYYEPIILTEQEGLKTIPGMTLKNIEQLGNMKSYTTKEAPIVKEEVFPVLIFSPGFGAQSQVYENIITNLVSHGYIVVGVNTLFTNGAIELPNGHIVKAANPKNRDDADTIFVPLKISDLSYVYHKLHSLHHSDPIFSAMKLTQMGTFGHSIGGKTVSQIEELHPSWFKAAVSLDIASYQPNEHIKKSTIPFMYIISAYWESFFSWPLVFELGNNEYLVTLSPSFKNIHYSYHMNYSDFSTLQYLPAYKMAYSYMKTKSHMPKDIKVMSSLPATNEYEKFKKPTYMLINSNNTWSLFYYEPEEKIQEIDVGMVTGLESAIAQLPQKKPESLSDLEIKPLDKPITAYHLSYGNGVGLGDGWKITKAINTYLLQFFDNFLKNKNHSGFKDCKTLTSDTILQCGPGVFGNGLKKN